MKHENELNSWRLAAVVVMSIAAVVFFTQHFVSRAFDVVLEVCIFYVPAVSIVVIFLYLRRKMKS